jgi:ABC-type polysaccharide/polyol phosphate transport system ATPase subunit
MISIGVNSLGKKFKLYTSPMGRFLEYLTLGKVTRHTDFWALQDISFEIPKGTTLGILGQNGSGKSTLLSILAGVLEPSTGSFQINGKVSAILELGSGFHPEFSGKDNIYMYGSIMGLAKKQIDERYEDIVRFSELGDFIDQPLRTYSSGMIVRLAFSVAINVDADILIVDEALAVGDAIFQHRCFRKIREMQAAGKTILYVGHDTEAARNICSTALLLDGGRIIERGDPNYVVNKYYALIADRERVYIEGNLTEHGVVPGDEYETVYDFIRNFDEAKIECTTEMPVQLQTIEIQSIPRHLIFAHPPSSIRYTVPVYPGSSLAFAIGILPGAMEKIPQGVKFDIEVWSEGETDQIFSRVLQPKRNIGDRGWHNFLIPLEKYSGKTVHIVFTTSGSGEDLRYGWSAWGWVEIVRMKKQEPNSVSIPPGNNTRPDEIDQNSQPVSNSTSKKAKIIEVHILDEQGSPRSVFNYGEIANLQFTVVFNESITENITVGCTIRSKYHDIYATNTRWENQDL